MTVQNRVVAGLLALPLALMLSACGHGYATTTEQIAEQAEFVATCEEAGGHASYNGVPTLICVFGEER